MEELFEGVSGLEMVDESPDRNPSAHEHRSASEDLGVAVHYLIGSHDLLSSRRAKFTRAAQVDGRRAAVSPRISIRGGVLGTYAATQGLDVGRILLGIRVANLLLVIGASLHHFSGPA